MADDDAAAVKAYKEGRKTHRELTSLQKQLVKAERDAEVKEMVAETRLRMFEQVMHFLTANGVSIPPAKRAALAKKFREQDKQL